MSTTDPNNFEPSAGDIVVIDPLPAHPLADPGCTWCGGLGRVQGELCSCVIAALATAPPVPPRDGEAGVWEYLRSKLGLAEDEPLVDGCERILRERNTYRGAMGRLEGWLNEAHEQLARTRSELDALRRATRGHVALLDALVELVGATDIGALHTFVAELVRERDRYARRAQVLEERLGEVRLIIGGGAKG